jgi:hypothetical protein
VKTFPLYRNLFLAPSLGILPSSPELQTLQAVLHVASGAPLDSPQSGSMVSFSGATVRGGGVVAALGTVAAESQLGIVYVARLPAKEGDGEVEVAVSATGTLWRRELEDVVRSLNAVWELVLEAAVVGGGDSEEEEKRRREALELAQLQMMAVRWLYGRKLLEKAVKGVGNVVWIGCAVLGVAMMVVWLVGEVKVVPWW